MWHIVYEKKYKVDCKKDLINTFDTIVDTFDAISSELENIAHPQGEIISLKDKSPVHIDFLVPDIQPITFVKLYGRTCTDEANTEVAKCIGMISFAIRYIREKDPKFRDLEDIAKRHGLTYVNTREHYSR